MIMAKERTHADASIRTDEANTSALTCRDPHPGYARVRRLMHSAWGGIFCAALAFAAFGCASGPKQQLRTPTAETMELLARAPSHYAPPAPTQDASGTEELRATFEAGLAPQVRHNMVHDPALDFAATALSTNSVVESLETSVPLAQWIAWRSGSAWPLLNWGWWWSMYGHNPVAELRYGVSHWAGRLKTIPGDPMAYGIALFHRGSYHGAGIIVVRHLFDVDPFPKAYPLGASLTLHVRLRSDAQYDPKLWMDDAAGNGKIINLPFTKQTDASYSITQALPQTAGKYFIAVTVDEIGSRALGLLAPIHVGVAEPSSAEPIASSPASGDPEAGWTQPIIAAVNEQRERAGVTPLAVDPALSALAKDSLRRSETERTPTWQELSQQAGARELYRIGSHPVERVEDFLQPTFSNPYQRAVVRKPGLESIGVAVEPTKDSEYRTVRVVVLLRGQRTDPLFPASLGSRP